MGVNTLVHVVFDGINGAGKSTYRERFEETQAEKVRRLVGAGRHGKAYFLGEWVAPSENLEQWCRSLGHGPTDINYEDLHFDGRIQRQREILKEEDTSFFSEERHPLAGLAYFLPALLQIGKITRPEFFQYKARTLCRLPEAHLPDIWVFVNTSPSIARQRIVDDLSRSDDERGYNSLDYLTALYFHLQEFMIRGVYERHAELKSPSPHVIIANGNFDLNDVPKSVDRVCEEIYDAVKQIFRTKRSEQKPKRRRRSKNERTTSECVIA